jgi:proteic killer suppression protein
MSPLPSYSGDDPLEHKVLLEVPPGNRLEQLKGKLAGFWSIRINQQWRVVFRWEDGSKHEVKIIAYH